MKLRTILLAVLCFPLCAQELLPRIVVDSSIDQSKIDISGLWAREVLPRIVRLSGQATLPESLTFKRCEDNSYGGGTYENPEICIAYSDSFSYKTDDIGELVYRTITHEVGHALSPYGINSFQNLDEGLAEAMLSFVYAELERQNPAVRTGSYVFVQDLLNNLDIHAAAETSNFYTHRGYPYQASGGTLELLLRTEEDFRAVGRAIEDRNWTFSGAKDCAETQACPGTISIADYAEQLQIIQDTAEEILLNVVPDGQYGPASERRLLEDF